MISTLEVRGWEEQRVQANISKRTYLETARKNKMRHPIPLNVPDLPPFQFPDLASHVKKGILKKLLLQIPVPFSMFISHNENYKNLKRIMVRDGMCGVSVDA